MSLRLIDSLLKMNPEGLHWLAAIKKIPGAKPVSVGVL